MNDPFERLDALPAMDLTLCVFPHLRHLLLVDCRSTPPTLHALAAKDVFTPQFYAVLERDFAATVRDGGRFPFEHMLALSGKVDEMVRNAAVAAVLLKVGAAEEPLPSVGLLVMSGGGLAQPASLLTRAFQRIMGPKADGRVVAECVSHVEQLALEERVLAQRAGWRDASDMLRDAQASFFILWEGRN